MLQFTARETGRYSLAETAQMALEGGCRWIEMQFADGTDAAGLRDTVEAVTEMCKEAGAFLLLRNHVAEAKELGIHGVYLPHGGLKAAVEARDTLGPEAVVGFAVTNPADVVEAARLDIDYVTLAPNMPLDEAQHFISEAKAKGECAPVVATCPAIPDEVLDLLAVGYAGISIDAATLGDDITAAVRAYLQAFPF